MPVEMASKPEGLFSPGIDSPSFTLIASQSPLNSQWTICLFNKKKPECRHDVNLILIYDSPP